MRNCINGRRREPFRRLNIMSGFSALKDGDAQEIDISEGDILKIRADGVLEREHFEYKYYYGRSWWDYGCYPSISIGKSRSNKEYINELKSIAKYYGYEPEDIDKMIGSGVSPYEIEDFLYCGGEI